MIKENCASCGDKINPINAEVHYKNHGNYCSKCNLKICALVYVRQVIRGQALGKTMRVRTQEKFKRSMDFLRDNYGIGIEYIRKTTKELDNISKLLAD